MSKNYTTNNTKTRTVQLIVDDSLKVGSSPSTETQIYEENIGGVRKGVISTDKLFIDNGEGERIDILTHLGDNYYTSEEVDELISSNMNGGSGGGGLNQDELDETISNRLKNYYTSSQVDSKIDNSLTNYYTQTQINSKFDDYYTSSEIDLKLQNINPSGSLDISDDRAAVSNPEDDLTSLKVTKSLDKYTISHGHIYTKKTLNASISKIEDKIAYVGNSKYCNIDTDMLTECEYTFYKNNALSKFEIDMPNLRSGYEMFASCTNLTSFNANLPILEYGGYMFDGNSNLYSIKTNLHNLKDGKNMFYNCSQLSSIDLTSLENLTTGDGMFANNSALKSFNYDMPKLTSAISMFQLSSIKTFVSDISNLENGKWMFDNSPITNFIGSLKSLKNGNGMFNNTSLSVDSIRIISETIKDVNDFETKPTITITWTTVPTEEDDIEKIKNYFFDIECKGWIVNSNI